MKDGAKDLLGFGFIAVLGAMLSEQTARDAANAYIKLNVNPKTP